MTRVRPRPIIRGVLAIVLCAVTGAGAWAYFSDGDSAERRSRLTFRPTLEQQQKIESLRASVSPAKPRFSSEEAHAKPNAKLFTYMAETSDEEHVVLASLDAIQSAYSSRSARKETPDADLDRVLLRHAASERPRVAVAALAAARIPLMMDQPSDELTRGLAELAAPERPAPRRHAALEALDLLRPNRRPRHVLAAFQQALAAKEVHLVSFGLLALTQSGRSLAVLADAETAELGAAVRALTRHADPGVSGRALGALGEVRALLGADERCSVADEQLGHAHPYVRAQAADVVSRCERPSAIHRLIERAGDMAEARYVLTGFRRLDGSPGALEHTILGRKRVAEAVLFGVSALSQQLDGVEPLLLTLGGPRQTQELVRQAGDAAKAWYSAQRDRIPRR